VGEDTYVVLAGPQAPAFTKTVVRVMGSHSGAAWAADLEARNSARRQEGARVAAHYKARAKEREERENAEARSKSPG
jgi:hypothetical protein